MDAVGSFIRRYRCHNPKQTALQPAIRCPDSRRHQALVCVFFFLFQLVFNTQTYYHIGLNRLFVFVKESMLQSVSKIESLSFTLQSLYVTLEIKHNFLIDCLNGSGSLPNFTNVIQILLMNFECTGTPLVLICWWFYSFS